MLFQSDSLIYETSHITRKESELILMNYAIKHQLTDYALEELLDVINEHSPHAIYTTKYMLLKSYKCNEEVQVHFYCPECKDLLISANDINNKNAMECEGCKKIYDKTVLRKNKKYFIYVPLKKQIHDFVNSEKYNLLKKQESGENIGGINTGEYYKILKQQGIIGENDLTLQFNTDGVKLFKSSPLSLWPLIVNINELGYKGRQKNEMLCGVWYDEDKPKVETFLKFFVEELKNLHEEGVVRTVAQRSITIKVHTIASPLDSIARALLQNIMQFNGAFGCAFCLHEGEVVTVGRGHTRVYPRVAAENRTIQSHKAHVQEAENSGNPCKGVKGFSILMNVPCFSIVDSFTVDYMHAVLLGVVKTIVDSWFQSCFHLEAWYIGDKIDDVDNVLTEIEPPCEITRPPQSLSKRKQWKASEWKNFLLYYSLVCLKNILPNKFFKHWFLLVYSMRIFLKAEISHSEFDSATKALKEFVHSVENTYGKQFYKYNVHLLLHIPRATRLFGQLWDTSTYPYEHYNGVLGKMFRNSQAVPEQICKWYHRSKIVEEHSIRTFSHPECPKSLKDLYIRLSVRKRLSISCIEHGADLRLLGVPTNIKLDLLQKNVIEEFIQLCIPDDVLVMYNRFVHKHVLWHGTDNGRLFKRNNSCAGLFDGRIVEISGICELVFEGNAKYYIVLGQLLETIRSEIIARHETQKISSKDLFTVVRRTGTLVAFDVNNVSKKLISMPYGEFICVSSFSNTHERD